MAKRKSSIIIIIISVLLCIILLLIFLSQQTTLFKREARNSQFTPSTANQIITEPDESTVPPMTTTAPETSVTTIPETSVELPRTSPPETFSSNLTTASEENEEPQTTTASTAGESTQDTTVGNEPDTSHEESLPPETVSHTSESEDPQQLPEIIETATHNNWQYDLRSLEISDTLPEGILLSDTTQSFSSFDTYDENGFVTSRGDSVASHLSETGEYDGYLGKSYCWVTIRLDLTNLTGQEDWINVGNTNLSFGKLKKVIYCGDECYRYTNSISVGYMNMHDYMEALPEEIQYYMLHFEPDETKELMLCYLIEKKFSDESFYLEMNIHNIDNDFDWFKLN